MTDAGAFTHDSVTDLALLERVLTGLRRWESPEPRRRTPSAALFGAACPRAKPGDPPVDVALPR